MFHGHHERRRQSGRIPFTQLLVVVVKLVYRVRYARPWIVAPLDFGDLWCLFPCFCLFIINISFSSCAARVATAAAAVAGVALNTSGWPFVI